jgi:hypothetical protein
MKPFSIDAGQQDLMPSVTAAQQKFGRLIGWKLLAFKSYRLHVCRCG